MGKRNNRKHVVDVAPLSAFATVMGHQGRPRLVLRRLTMVMDEHSRMAVVWRHSRGGRAEMARTTKGFTSTDNIQTGDGRVHRPGQKAK